MPVGAAVWRGVGALEVLSLRICVPIASCSVSEFACCCAVDRMRRRGGSWRRWPILPPSAARMSKPRLSRMPLSTTRAGKQVCHLLDAGEQIAIKYKELIHLVSAAEVKPQLDLIPFPPFELVYKGGKARLPAHNGMRLSRMPHIAQ
jgi:hypothetical protein